MSEIKTESKFNVGQQITISGGKHKKTIAEGEKCIITGAKSTFCEISVFGEAIEPLRKIQVHRKFMVPIQGVSDATEPVVADAPPTDDNAVEMPAQDDCVVVTQEEMDNINRQTESTGIVSEVVNEVVEEAMTVTPDGRHSISDAELVSNTSTIESAGVVIRDQDVKIKALEQDLESYRDMMLGHQNELTYLRQQTGPTVEERKERNEKIIQCINILLSLQ